MTEAEAIVLVVDDNPEVRISTACLLQLAVAFLDKLFNDEVLLGGIQAALQCSWGGG